MATPDTAILINQLTQEATSLVGDEFLLIENAGVHKKITVANLGTTEIWKVNPALSSEIYYDDGNIGIGTNAPTSRVHINAAFFGVETAVKVTGGTSNYGTFSLATGSSEDNNQGYTYDVAGVPKWRVYYKEAAGGTIFQEMTYEKIGLGKVLRLNPASQYSKFMDFLKLVPGVTGELWTDNKVIKISP